MTHLKPITESSVISIAARLKHPGASRIIKGIGDDCAVVRTPGAGATLISTDVFIEGVHFLPDQTPESIGGKLLAVNLSDIAAMGGKPGEAVVAMMLPESISLPWVERFYAGMEDVALRFGVDVVGGDISRHPDRITLALTLTGRARRDEILYRSGGRPDDYLYVSGTLGDADAGLEFLRSSVESANFKFQISNFKSKYLCPSPRIVSGTLGDADARLEILKSSVESTNFKFQISNFKSKYLCPSPRIELGRLLAKTRTASACIDLSDGIAVGARQLAEASRLAIEIDGSSLPISGELNSYCIERTIDPLGWALKAGGDYELLFSVRPENARRVDRFGNTRPELPPVTRIGRLIAGNPGRVTVNWLDRKEELVAGGWEHFAAPG